MKMTNVMLRLCTTLCLIAGFAAFGAGCGDDNGGGGDDCETGEELLVVDGVEGCYQTCEGDSDCSGGATCVSGAGDVGVSICRGGSGNNDADAGGDAGNDADGDVGLQCAEGEVAANPDFEGEACYQTCTDTSECTGAEECTELTGGTSICFETPTGDQECSAIINCQSGCDQQDQQCQTECYFEATSDAQDTYDAMSECASENCDQSNDPNCFRDNCQAEVDACAGCTADEIEINFECVLPCEDATECGENEECVQPYLGLADQTVCSYSPDALADACTDHPDCGGPDPSVTQGGQGFCSTQAPGGMCLAVGCNFQSQYGPGTGCGLEGICFEQSDGTQSIGVCSLLCREQSDCPRGDTEDYACRIVQEIDGERTGLCDPACASDADCAFSGGLQGQCNHLGYCELPCAGDGTCAQAGGTCDENDFCVFDPEPAE